MIQEGKTLDDLEHSRKTLEEHIRRLGPHHPMVDVYEKQLRKLKAMMLLDAMEEDARGHA